MKKQEFKKALKNAIVDHGYWSNEVNQTRKADCNSQLVEH